MSIPSVESPIELIAGIGNPGQEYADTRHNAGVWLVRRLADQLGATFKTEKKFLGQVAIARLGGRDVKLLIPDTYMNESGKCVGAYANFFKIPVESIVIAHDEIDFPGGKIRFKQGGGLAGHNGLKSISASLAGSKEYARIRIGVGHPGDQRGVTGHVLGKVSKSDRAIIDECIQDALSALPIAANGDWQSAMNELHNIEQPFQRDQESD